MHEGPSITSEQLIAALQENDIIDEAGLVSLLGQARHDVGLYKLESVLIRQNVLSQTRLLLLKGMVSGLPVLDNTDLQAKEGLEAAVSRSAGALLLDIPDTTVAFIEDLPQNVERVARALGNWDFHVWLMTAHQFTDLHKNLYRGEKRDTRPVCGNIFEVFDEAVKRRASDIHIAVGQPPALRIDGSLLYMNKQPLDIQWILTELERIAGPDRMQVAIETFAVDFAYQFGDARFRCNIGANSLGMNLAARTLPTKIPTMDDLALPQALRNFAELERGLVLVTGPTGSGKSTTLASILGHIALNQDRHLITLEDPIEYTLPQDGKSHVDQRELDESFVSFPDGLRQALRQDPDVILVGELRDLDTMRTAITAAETGHLVFGTLHTYDASSTLGRLVSSFGAEEQDQVRAQLAYILKGIVSQTLLPHASGKGRVAAFEIMVATPAVANNLRKIDGHSQLRQALETGKRDGMQTMEMSLADLVRKGLIREVDAEFKARDTEDFRRRLHGSE